MAIIPFWTSKACMMAASYKYAFSLPQVDGEDVSWWGQMAYIKPQHSRAQVGRNE
jgi:hypothetical protein